MAFVVHVRSASGDSISIEALETRLVGFGDVRRRGIDFVVVPPPGRSECLIKPQLWRGESGLDRVRATALELEVDPLSFDRARFSAVLDLVVGLGVSLRLGETASEATAEEVLDQLDRERDAAGSKRARLRLMTAFGVLIALGSIPMFANGAIRGGAAIVVVGLLTASGVNIFGDVADD